MAMYGFFGNLGQGKTVSAIFFLHFFHYKKKLDVLSNVHLNMPYQYVDMEKIYDLGKNNTSYFKNKVLFIDEIHLLMESRRSSASVNVDFSQNILIQLGKLDTVFLYTSQMLSQVDLRIRQMGKYYIFCTKVDYNGNKVDSDLRITPCPILIDLEINTRFSDHDWERSFCTIDPKPYFGLYDTREIIQFDRDKFLKK